VKVYGCHGESPVFILLIFSSFPPNAIAMAHFANHPQITALLNLRDSTINEHRGLLSKRPNLG